MTIFDTHAHLNFSAFRDDADEVIKRSLENGVFMVNVGSQYTTSRRAVRLAEKYKEGVYAAVGLHPIHLETRLVKIDEDPQESEFKTREEEFDYERYKELAQSEKVVAIGEIGLDYWSKPKGKKKLELFKERQKQSFLRQLALARELNLAAIFHCRKAHNDLIAELTNLAAAEKFKLRGVVHCFTGTLEEAERYLEMGLYLGFNGIIYKLDLAEVIKKIPLERILLETDCPYLTPLLAANQRNEPLYVKYVAQTIAEIRNEPYEKIVRTTTESGKDLFLRGRVGIGY